MKRLLAFGAAVAAATAFAHPAAGVQVQSPAFGGAAPGNPHVIAQTVWDSIYSGEQAARGESTYKSTCMKCHGETLAGTDSAVSLAGNDFVVNWDGLTLDQLYDKILTTMPSDNPKSLPSNKVIDVLAFVLSKNNFPAGSAALPDDVAVLKGIKFTKSKP